MTCCWSSCRRRGMKRYSGKLRRRQDCRFATSDRAGARWRRCLRRLWPGNRSDVWFLAPRAERGNQNRGACMPIFDQGYQHWQGNLSGHAWRWLAIARHGVRAQFRNRWVRIVLLLAWLPALSLAGVLTAWGLIEQKASFVMPLLSLFRLPDEIT